MEQPAPPEIFCVVIYRKSTNNQCARSLFQKFSKDCRPYCADVSAQNIDIIKCKTLVLNIFLKNSKKGYVRRRATGLEPAGHPAACGGRC
jgi:hypothetical protein